MDETTGETLDHNFWSAGYDDPHRRVERDPHSRAVRRQLTRPHADDGYLDTWHYVFYTRNNGHFNESSLTSPCLPVPDGEQQQGKSPLHYSLRWVQCCRAAST
jgi:hypothetical protein